MFLNKNEFVTAVVFNEYVSK